MTCSTGCRTQDHASWGECVRAKNLRTNALEPEMLSIQRRADKNLDDYANARRYGIQPKSTRPQDVQGAIRMSEHKGEAFHA